MADADKAGSDRVGHRGRLRDKFLAHGLDKFTDEEIVELLLTLATPRRDCKPAARAAMRRFGGLAAILEADIDELTAVDGIGPANAFGLRFVHAVARKFLRDRIVRGADFIDSYEAVVDYFTHALRDSRVESSHVLFLNAQNGIIHEERLADGSPTAVSFSPRRVVERGFAVGAAVIVIAHNHPGGPARPSKADLTMTKELVYAARLLDLTVRDHLIIGEEGAYSFWREGLIGKYERDFARWRDQLGKAP
jgi:DNA repair protein RadC